METKTYYARELPSILDQIKQELGDEAIIVKSRRTRAKGILGFFQKPVYEVVVSFDPEENKNKQNQPKPKSNPLSGFGKDADRRLAAAATAAAAKASSAREKRIEETLPPVSLDSFAELISMAGALEAEENTQDTIQPAWITPTAKLGAYVSLQQPAARPAPKPLQQPADGPPRYIEADNAYALQSARQAVKQAAFASSANVTSSPYVPPVIGAAAPQGEAVSEPEAAQMAPAKRKRGRPKKASQAEKLVNAPSARQEPGAGTEQGEAIASRLDVVEQMLRTLVDDMRSGANDSARTDANGQDKAPDTGESAFPQEARDEERIRGSLLNQDVDLPVAEELIKRAGAMRDKNGMRLEQAMERVLKETLGKPKYLRGSTKTARTVMLIGPTGVGKTTTLVKLAAGCMFERKANVAIINADVFRVGAQDQLKAYAKILDVPLKTIYATKELKGAINEFTDRDFIFIDTCGKASSDKEYQNEIRELLNTGKVQDVYLVVSSTTSGRVCRQIVESYDFIKQYKTILTKLDESGSIGGAVNLSFYSGQPLSYVTIGQNVPDDISKVDVEEVIERLMR